MATSADERLILVSPNDEVVGYDTKERCHDGRGILHRAFSVFLFNDKGDVLLQQRSAAKRLWPLYWSNSCCSHPRETEDILDAVARRLDEELGVETKLSYLYKFEYQASFAEAGAEHELCYVYIGRANSVRHNPDEIAAVRFISAADLNAELKTHPELFTPWMKLEWERLMSDYRLNVARLFNRAGGD